MPNWTVRPTIQKAAYRAYRAAGTWLYILNIQFAVKSERGHKPTNSWIFATIKFWIHPIIPSPKICCTFLLFFFFHLRLLPILLLRLFLLILLLIPLPPPLNARFVKFIKNSNDITNMSISSTTVTEKRWICPGSVRIWRVKAPSEYNWTDKSDLCVRAWTDR